MLLVFYIVEKICSTPQKGQDVNSTVSRTVAKASSAKARTPPAAARGLDRGAIVAAALAEMDEQGEVGFSLRRVAARLGRDPMAVLYHLGSRENLERAVAEALNAEVPLPDAGLPWRTRLAAVADSYRALAHRHPLSFPLLLRFWTTGPSDYAMAEAVYAALGEAGFDAEAAADFGCGFYAAVLGFCTGEVRGLLAPEPPPEALAEVASLPEATHPVFRRLAAAFGRRDPETLWRRTREALLDGIEVAARREGLS
jgi:AcrR family transcriptional regulator